MGRVDLEKEIEDRDCVTGISFMDKMFGDFPAQPAHFSVLSKFCRSRISAVSHKSVFTHLFIAEG